MEASAAPQPIASLSLSDLAEAEPVSGFEQQALDRLKRNYENIIETSPLEEVVKLVVVAPLLDLAGFYQPPFSIHTDVSTKLVATDNGQTFTGSIDVLVVKQHLWILVIESKQSRFDVTSGIAQALRYMLSQSLSKGARTPPIEPATSIDQFSLVTNGREVVLLKLNSQQPLVYTQSRIYQVIDAEEDLTCILQGLKVIGKRSL